MSANHLDLRFLCACCPLVLGLMLAACTDRPASRAREAKRSPTDREVEAGTARGRAEAQRDLAAGKLVLKDTGDPLPYEKECAEVLRRRFGVDLIHGRSLPSFTVLEFVEHAARPVQCLAFASDLGQGEIGDGAVVQCDCGPLPAALHGTVSTRRSPSSLLP